VPVSLTPPPGDDLEIELWGATFSAVRITRSVRRALAKVEERGDKATDEDKEMAVLGDLLDLQLQSVGDGPKASALLLERWKKDDLEVAEAWDVVSKLAEAQAARRPT
jgi:hypothetical protein